jgi:hypothetical protein
MTITTRPPKRNTISANIHPIACYAYTDWFQVWLTKPLSARQMAWLKSQCREGVHCWEPPPHLRWDPLYRVRLQLKQPSREAIQFIAAIDGALVNFLEVALDWIFATAKARDLAYQFVAVHSYKKHLRRDPLFDHETRYSDKKGAATNLTTYPDRPCKLTGELYCVHNELRITGSPAMRRHGLSLLKLNLPALWHAFAFLYDPDLSHLGRMVANITRRRRKLTSRRIPKLSRSGRNVDELIGRMAFHYFGGTVQTVVNFYRKRHVAVTRCLHQLDMAHLIPKQQDYYPAKQGETSYDRCTIYVDTLPTILKHHKKSVFVHALPHNFSRRPAITSQTIPAGRDFQPNPARRSEHHMMKEVMHMVTIGRVYFKPEKLKGRSISCYVCGGTVRDWPWPTGRFGRGIGLILIDDADPQALCEVCFNRPDVSQAATCKFVGHSDVKHVAHESYRPGELKIDAESGEAALETMRELADAMVRKPGRKAN